MSDDKRLQRIEIKLDDMGEHLGIIDVAIAKNTIILEEHQRRSEANEEMVAMLSQELQPIKRRVYMAQGAIALLGLLALIAGIISAFK